MAAKGVRVLVTGATGEVGAAVIAALDRERFVPRVMSRREPDGDDGNDGIERVQADLVPPTGLDEALRDVDIVLHLAALTHSREAGPYFATNERGTAHLVEAAARAKVERFVHMSTRAVGEAGGAYSHSKALAEARVRESELPWVILRPGEVYGGGGRDPILALARDLSEKEWVPVLGSGGQGFAPVHVEDVAQATARALEAREAVGEVLTLVGPERMTYLELVSRIETVLGVPRRRRIHVPVVLARLAIRVASVLGIGDHVPDQVPRLLLEKGADADSARRILDFAPRFFAEGLTAALEGSP